MAFKTFADGVALPASDLNTYLMKQAVIVCTAGTRPASPIEGMTIYETDTDKLLIYTTATTLWQPPWNMPWGRIASASVTANQTTITTTVDLTSLTLSVAQVKDRRYKYTAIIRVQSNTASDYFGLQLVDATPTTVMQSLFVTHVSANNDVTVALSLVETAASTATVTRKLQGGRVGGSAGTFQMSASSIAPAQLTCEDIGNAAAPA